MGHQVASKHVQHFLNRSDFRAIFFMPKWIGFWRGFLDQAEKLGEIDIDFKRRDWLV
jgi:hypothetical protein